MRALKVLHIVSSAQLGGAERVALDIAVHLDPRSFVSCLLLPSEGPLAKEIGRLHTQLRVIDELSGLSKLGRHSTSREYARTAPDLMKFILGLRRLGKWAAEERFDLVHAHGWKSHLIAAALRTLIEARQVWHVHDFISNRGFRRWYGLIALSCADRLIAVSEAVARDLPSGLPTEVVHNGVALNGYAARRSSAPPETCLVTLLGVLAPWKGQRVFLEAIADLVKEFPYLQAEIVGDEIYATKGHAGIRRSLEERSEELGLAGKVRFTGWVESVQPILMRTDILVHASTEPEPFGRVLIEAMAASKPVIATSAGGVPEIVEDGSTGLLVPRKDPGALARAITVLLKDPDRRNRMGAAGRERVERHFTIEQQVRTIESIYRQIVGTAPGRTR